MRLRVGLNYSLENLLLMLAIYALAALPFFAGGAVISLAISRLAGQNQPRSTPPTCWAHRPGCLLLLPLLDRVGAPGVVLATAAPGRHRGRAHSRRRPPCAPASLPLAVLLVAAPWVAHASGLVSFDVTATKGHAGDTRAVQQVELVLPRGGLRPPPRRLVAERHATPGPMPDSRFMDIDSAASTPIIRFAGDLASVAYLKSELTALGYHLAQPGFTALVIGPGGGRDLLSALVFGARRVDGVEINPIIANDVMRDRFLDYSGRLYTRPDVRIYVEDGRSFVRRSPERYDVIQASLVDTWAATAAGAYTLTENSLYTVEAFDDYLDHLSDRGFLTITRWALDGVRLVSLAQEACARRGWNAADRLAVVQHEKVATFILKKSPFTAAEVQLLQKVCDDLKFTVLYAPGLTPPERLAPTGAGQWEAAADAPNDYARLILAADRQAFYAGYPLDITPTTDDRPFFFHTTKLKDQVRRRVRADDAVRQRPQRADDADGHLDGAGAAVHRRPDGAERPRAARQPSGRGGWPTSGCSAPGSCWWRWRCCSGSCCCWGTRCTR